MRPFVLAVYAALALPATAMAQGSGPGPTQSRDGLSTASQGQTSNNAMPAGSVNAATGPQSRPAYPSGSTTANPGAAFVKTMPVPSTGPLAKPSGVTATKTVSGAGAAAHPASPGVGQAATPPK